jgi:quinol monooxygenase YgiN
MNSKSPLTVIAILKAKPGLEPTVKKELQSLVTQTRKETGCINYDLHQDLQDPARFLFHETWATKAHLDAHLEQPYLTALFAKAEELLAEPPQLYLTEKLD